MRLALFSYLKQDCILYDFFSPPLFLITIRTSDEGIVSLREEGNNDFISVGRHFFLDFSVG